MGPAESLPKALASSSQEERLHSVLASYLEALEAGAKPEPEEYLRRHPELASELRRFFENQDHLVRVGARVSVLAPAAPPGEEAVPAPFQPRAFGDYELLEELARGGMGVIYKARHASLGRTVALKMVLSGPFASGADLERFRREAQAEARLDHPHIVPIYDVGEVDGQPYFTMKLIDGGSLAAHVHDFAAKPREAARLLETAGRTVHFAHSRGVIHRDLKPSNILLDGEGEPFITDFGLAMTSDSDPSLTATGAVVGTPSYMSPEQAAGKKQAELTAAADVYSLGAVLYELLTGRPPFRADSSVETLRQVLEEEPLPPSRLRRHVPRDLETICLRCLEKDPRRRCGSAAELADELRRYVDGVPITWRPVGILGRAGRWARRRPARAALIALGIAAAVTLLGLGLSYLTVSKSRALLARRQLYLRDMEAAAIALENISISDDARALLRRHIPGPGEEDLRGFDWFYLWNYLYSERAALRGGAGLVHGIEGSRDGRILLLKTEHPRVWNLEENYEIQLPDSEDARGSIYCGLSPDGRALAALSGERALKLWEIIPDQGKLVGAAPRELLTKGGHALSFSPDGEDLWWAKPDGRLGVWKLESRRELEVGGYSGMGPVTRIDFTSDGRTVLIHVDTSSNTGWVASLWDVQAQGDSVSLRRRDFSGPMLEGALDLSPDGMWIASRSSEKDPVKVFEAATGQEKASLNHSEGMEGYPRVASFSPDGKLLATSEAGFRLLIWDVATGELLRTFNVYRSWSLAFLPDGKSIAVSEESGAVKVLDLDSLENPEFIARQPDVISFIGFSPDGRSFTTGDFNFSVKRWELKQGRLGPSTVGLEVLKADPSLYEDGEVSPDGRFAAGARLDRTVEIASTETAALTSTLKGFDTVVHGTFFSPDSRSLATLSGEGTLQFWGQAGLGDGTDWRKLTRFKVPQGFPVTGGPPLPQGIFSRDGSLFALSTNRGGRLLLLDVVHGRAVADFSAGWRLTRALAFSSDSKLLAAASSNGTVKIWKVDQLGLKETEWTLLAGHKNQVLCLAFSPDGKVLATGSMDGLVKLWDLALQTERLTLKGHKGQVRSLAFSPDGRTLVSGGGLTRELQGGPFGELIIWRAATDEEVERRLRWEAPR